MCDIIRIVILTAAITLALTVGAVACNKPFDNAPQSSAGEFIPDSLPEEENNAPDETEPTLPPVPVVSRQEQLAKAEEINEDTVAWLLSFSRPRH